MENTIVKTAYTDGTLIFSLQLLLDGMTELATLASETKCKAHIINYSFDEEDCLSPDVNKPFLNTKVTCNIYYRLEKKA